MGEVVDSREGWGGAVAGQAALLGGGAEVGGHGACQEEEKKFITIYFEFRRARQKDGCRSGTRVTRRFLRLRTLDRRH